jgi:tetratricopeptide (TPR) repeat protein
MSKSAQKPLLKSYLPWRSTTASAHFAYFTYLFNCGGSPMMLPFARYLALLPAMGLILIASSDRQTGRTDSPHVSSAPDKTTAATSEPSVARLLQELQSWTASSPSRVAKAQAQTGDPAAARATLQQALQVANESFKLCEIANVQAEIGDRDAALKTLLKARRASLAEDRQRWETARTLGEIATVQLQLGDRTASRESFEQALRFAMTLQPDQKIIAIQAIIEARAAAGDFVAALETVASIGDLGERLDALTRIDVKGRNIETEVLGRILRMIDADGIPPDIYRGVDVRTERVNGLRIDALMGMALAQATANDRASARKNIQRARQIADTLQGDATRYLYIGRITKALVRMGAVSQASGIADAIGDTTWNRKLGVLTDIAEAHAEIGDRAAALRALDDALQAAKTSSDKLRVLLKIANAQMTAGDREDALRTLQQALLTAKSIKPEDDDAGLFAIMGFPEALIAKARANAKDIIGATQLANTIKNNAIRGHALAEIAEARAASGDIKGAIGTAETIRPPDRTDVLTHGLRGKESALLGIISVQAKAGDVNGALVTADRLSLRNGRFSALIVIAEGLDQRNNARKRSNALPAR